MKLLSTAKAFGIVALLATAGSAAVMDDFSGDPITGAKNGFASDGKGQWGPDNSAFGATASVEFNVDGTFYGVDPITDDAACPREGFDESGDGVIDGAETGCYWGWSMEDGGYGADGLTAQLIVKDISAQTGWNYADAGFIYAFDAAGKTGATLREKGSGVAFNASDKFLLDMTIPLGQKLKVKAFADDYVDGSGLPFIDITGTGSKKTYELGISDFQPQWSGAPTLDPSNLDALFIGFSSGGATQDAPVPAAADFPVTFHSLCLNDCSGASTSLINTVQGSLINMQVTENSIDFVGVNANTQVEVFSIAGESVARQSLSANGSVSLTDLNNGVYVVRVNEAGKSPVQQSFVLNR